MGNQPSQPTPEQSSTTTKTNDLALSIKSSSSCDTCKIILDPTLSSSTVTLTRDILGKMNIAKKKYPPSNLPQDAMYDGDWHDLGNHKKEDYATAFDGTRYSIAKNGSLLYSPPYPGSDFPEVLSKADTEKMPGKIEYAKKYADQSFVENANRKKIDAENKLEKKRVRIWNPSDEPTDPEGSIKLNYNNYGALTKLHIKPSIPFKVEFNPY
jgi:hypothetical protein